MMITLGCFLILFAPSFALVSMALFVLYILGFTLGTKGIIFLSLTGFFVGILWPTVMCFAMQVFGKDVAIASSVIIVLSGTVNGIVQLLTGFTYLPL